jgi:DNA ligase (NAD+)
MTQARIAELVKRITTERRNYYNGVAKVSDPVFDTWVNELESLDPKNPVIIEISTDLVSEWVKYTHKVPMGSLNKCQTVEEFAKWYKDFVEKGDSLFLTTKLDGLSVSLVYENGILASAATRGRGGVSGELITQNVIKMNNVPLRLPVKANITVRGEILLSKANLNKYFPDYSNTRNAASGISRRYDGEGSDKLDVLVYHIIDEDHEYNTYTEQFEQLGKYGFKTPPYYTNLSYQGVLDKKAEYADSLRDQFEYDLDGLVVHNDNLLTHEKYGRLNGRPYCSIAYKFDAVYKEAFISDIICQVGNSGRITPVAEFHPAVNLMGSTIQRATLHNFSIIEDLGIGIGATVLICKANDVIPFVEEVVNPPQEVFTPPTECPECKTKLINVGEYVQCPNVDGCPAQISGRIKNWVKELNVLELGAAIIEKLVASRLVKTPADLYKLTVKDIAGLERMGEKSAKNIIESLWKVNPIPLDIFIGGLSIPMIGSSTARLLIDEGYDTFDKIYDLTVDDIEKIKGIGPVRAKYLAIGLVKYSDTVKELLNNGVKIREKVIGKLTNQKFAFTGAMENKRAVLEQMVVDNGGAIGSGKSLTYLVIDDTNSTSSKAVSARKNGTRLLSEQEFLDLIK